MTHNRTDTFLAALDELAARPLPASVVHEAKMCLVDYVACATLGNHLGGGVGLSFAAAAGEEDGPAALIGAGRGASPHVAALVNALHAHVTELDDGHRFAMMHVGTPVISALLACAATSHMTGYDLLKGIVMGVEAEVRLASAIQPGHKLKGYHATATCGTIGAALGISYALGYTDSQKKAALSAAVTDAAGLLAMMDDVSTLKAFNVGRAAGAGVDAALIARTGLLGPHDALGGKRGLFAAMADEVDDEPLTAGLGGSYAIQTSYRKPYAACRHCHAAIEAAMRAMHEAGVTADEISDVLVETYGLAVYGHDHTSIAGAASAKMSMPYSVAVALACQQAGYRQFEQDYLDDPFVRELTKKVGVREDPALSALVPHKRAAIVTVSSPSRSATARVDYPKGEPENPMDADELEAKAFDLMQAAGKSEDAIRILLQHAWNVEEDLEELLTCL